MPAWQQGRATIDQMLASRHLESVPADLEAARALVSKARTHLRSAAALAATDVESRTTRCMPPTGRP